jgi:hypothetical protein
MNGSSPQSMDPGEIENRLSLNPSNPDWKNFLGEWSDGEEYTLTVKVTQISPGEFQVTEATPKDSPAQEKNEQPGSTDEPEGGTDENGYAPGTNPAVVKMARG